MEKVFPYRWFIYLDETTYKNLEKQSRNAKKTKPNFVRDLINKRIGLKKLSDIHRAIRINEILFQHLAAIGNNINQIAHRVNEDSLAFNEKLFNQTIEPLKEDVSELKFELKLINKKLKGIV